MRIEPEIAAAAPKIPIAEVWFRNIKNPYAATSGELTGC
jgi:hypothetical protein